MFKDSLIQTEENCLQIPPRKLILTQEDSLYLFSAYKCEVFHTRRALPHTPGSQGLEYTVIMGKTAWRHWTRSVLTTLIENGLNFAMIV